MANDTEATENLVREIERLRDAQPHLGSLLDSFGPLVLERTRWLSETDVEPRTLPIDPLLFAEGVPLNRQHQLLVAEDPWGSAGWSVVKAITQGFPHLGEDMNVLLRQLSEGNYQSLSLLLADTEEADKKLDEKAAELEISPVSLVFYLRALNRFMLTKKARDMQAELAGHVWRKGYCPVCGSYPHLAILGEQGQRLLQCGDCGHAWSFPRLTCPYCDHQNPENTNILFIEGQKEHTAFTCEKCRRYLLTANRASDLGRTHADLIAMSLIHLDIIMQEKGYSPMTESDWNSFIAPKD